MRRRQDRDTTGTERGRSLQPDKQLLSDVDLQQNADDCGGVFSVDQRPIQQPFGGFGRDLVERRLHTEPAKSTSAIVASVTWVTP